MDLHKSYETFFLKATRTPPYDYQTRLAIGEQLPELVEVATGLGKTAAIMLGWLWRRRLAKAAICQDTPRRLVYCLPTRVLVEQTFENCVRWLHRLGMLAGTAEWEGEREARLKGYEPALATYVPVAGWAAEHGDRGAQIATHVLMGGENTLDWDIYPEKDVVLIGTQDMLLSRALNRGYAMSRSRWPVQLGLLNNDCLWVLDEVQLMGNGAATSAQLDAFRKALWTPVKPCSSLWMSATLGDQVLRTRDREDLGLTPGTRLSLSDEERKRPEIQQRLNAEKTLELLKKEPEARKRDGTGVLDLHLPGRLSLVILNTVPTAQRLFSEIRDALQPRARRTKRGQSPPDEAVKTPPVLLLHSRYRPADRRDRMREIDLFRERQSPSDGAVSDDPGLILVSTQVVEAGYDISAARLWSEIASWASTVQRLGRLNREGLQPDARALFWVPKSEPKGENAAESPNAKRIGPYEKHDLELAKELLGELSTAQASGKSYRQALDQIVASEPGRRALEIKPEAVLRPDDFFGLFSTEPDLAGGYTDISPFVRSIDRDVDVLLFWRDFDPKRGPSADVERDEQPPPHRDELCAVPFFVFRKFLDKGRCWEWDFESDWWQPRRAVDVFPGMTLLLACSQGGYSPELGWTGRAADKPSPVTLDTPDGRGRRRLAVDSMTRDPASEVYDWHSIADHLNDVVAETKSIVQALNGIPSELVESLELAATWHDWGKSVPRWQEAVRRYAERVVWRIDELLSDATAASFHDAARSMRQRFRRGLEDANGTLWAKFPDARRIIEDLHLSEEDHDEFLRRVRANFRPNLRHEAASALAAWQTWRHGASPLTALAVYLIAAHHGKVRMVLRALTTSDEVFGLTNEDRLQPVAPRFLAGADLSFAPKVVGHRGQWSDDGKVFIPTEPCWNAAIAELLGPPPGRANTRIVIGEGDPAGLGPFKLAYLEALLRAADTRASNSPGQEAKS